VVPLRKGVLGLLQQKVEKDAVLQEKACRLIDDLEDGFGGVGVVDVDAQFEVTSDLSVFHQKASASADGVRKSQDVILDLAGFRVLLAHGKQDVKDALGRGVRVRVITEEPENPEEDTFGFEHPLLTVKYVQAPVSISMMLYDDKEVHLRITEENVPSFWSNNPHILNLAKTYFDENWSKL
jgi:sugar-specific transcriptional regulator TrmB